MDALPNSSDTSFQLFLAKLLEQPLPDWTEKQQMELDMARTLSGQMVRLAEDMRSGTADLTRCLVLLRYAKVLDFMLTSLAARRDIHPQTLRTLFRLANLKVDDAYPV
ncbi:DNA-binding protein [Burkholderia sp. Bp9017]|uniref:DNA-binding protein n=1 Tax=Burkholderia anthina TaxID=179879 RepID=A0A7T6VLI7_9BURK|nr:MULTISPECIES: DNA-binding protein [Burkholderia]MBY4868959.1 DNA-binding protein [Burkholderia anthina]QQK06160.1 DNA-binding protein [Burkholderia anthina]RQZ17932.1 DNA-binding protein [Burkholderia sp. Bp9017]RQZ28090.1 DNA-binding protein [Burkholderia sp. Bp9016]